MVLKLRIIKLQSATGVDREILQTLRDAGLTDEETLGLFARTSKDLWSQSGNSEARTQHLRNAYIDYADAYKSTDGYWTGINAAALAFLANDDSADALARRVRDQCRSEIDALPADVAAGYWPLATLGEVELLLGNAEAALEWYA